MMVPRDVIVLLALLGAALSLPAPSSPPFQHWRSSQQGRARGCNNVVHNVAAFGASPSADAETNQAAINAALAAMQTCDTLLIPEGNYTVLGGIAGRNLRNATIVINGMLSFVDPSSPAFTSWPTCTHCFAIDDSIDVAITSDRLGFLNGNGMVWWDKMIVGDLPWHGCDRPKLLVINNCADVLVEKQHLLNSPNWNLLVNSVRAEIRHVSVETDRERLQHLKRQAYGDIKKRIEEWFLDQAVKFLPSWFLQPEDLNTDGIDPSGVDFWIHDCNISNDDDSIAVKPSEQGTKGIDGTTFSCSQNMLIENMQLTGFGASIGSVGPSEKRNCVDGITFRNISMPGTGKGVYIKSNGKDCVGTSSQLTNLLFENVDIVNPFWFAIWIGPQQQHEPNSKLGLDCAITYPLAGTACPTQGCSDFENITLKDISIVNPLLSPGAIMGNSTNPMRNITFDNVVVKQSSPIRGRFPWREHEFPWTGTYKSINVQGTCIDCHPVPSGFTAVRREGIAPPQEVAV